MIRAITKRRKLKSAIEFYAPLMRDLGTEGGTGVATFTRSTVGNYFDGSLWQSAAVNAARHHYSLAGVPLGVLIEGARTNLALNSLMSEVTGAALDTWTAYTTGDSVSTTAAATAVGSGLSTKEAKLVGGSGGEIASIYQVVVVTAGTKYAFSVGYRDIGAGTLALRVYDNENAKYLQANNTWAAGSAWLAVPRSTTHSEYNWVGSGGLTYLTAQTGCSNITIEIGTDGVTASSEHRVQFTTFAAGEFASSPIKTTTASVQRTADVLTFPSSGNINAAQGTVVVDVTPEYAAAVYTSNAMVFDVRTVTDGALLYHIGGAKWSLLMTSGGGTVCSIASSTSTPTRGSSLRLAAAWKSNDFEFFSQGASDGTPDTSGNAPTGVNTNVYVGSSNVSTSQFFGTIRNLRIYSQRLTTAQIASLGAA